MAASVLRPMDYPVLNSEVRFGDDTLAPGLADDLQNYYDKTDNPDDRAKCMELIASIRTGETVKPGAVRRPYTALPPQGTDHAKNFLSPYQTSYNRDYPLKRPIDTVALRPMTSHGYPPQMGPGPDTHYENEFMHKATRPLSPVRPGTASGHRANNPHPPESFLVWKFPRHGPKETEGAKWSEELTDDKINQVHKRLCQSTYQTDYLGVPQGFQLKSAYTLPPDWKENIPYTLDSVKRYSFQNHPQPDELYLPNTRYGSNRKKQIPAAGTIPTASNRHMHIRNRTTYDRHYNDNADAVTSQIREVGQKLGAEALRKYYEAAAGEDPIPPYLAALGFLPSSEVRDRTMAKNLLEAYPGRRITPTPRVAYQHHVDARPPSGRVSRKSFTPASTPVSTPYVPLPPPKDPLASRMSFNVYSPPELLR